LLPPGHHYKHRVLGRPPAGKQFGRFARHWVVPPLRAAHVTFRGKSVLTVESGAQLAPERRRARNRRRADRRAATIPVLVERRKPSERRLRGERREPRAKTN